MAYPVPAAFMFQPVLVIAPLVTVVISIVRPVPTPEEVVATPVAVV